MREILFGVALVFVARTASADDCAALPDEPGSPIPKLYIENGDTQEPLIKRLGKLLMQSSSKVRIIYRKRPTCELRDSVFTGAKMTEITSPTARPVNYIPVDPSFDPTKAAPTCTVPDKDHVADAQPIVLGVGATYISSCPTATQPADVGVLEGPVQAYGFITTKNSSQVAITGEEGYLAYGFTGGAGEANPWIIQDLRFKRGNTASTTLTISSAIRLLPSQMQAHEDSGTSEDIIASVIAAASSATPDAALGILGTELYDQHRDDIKLLAFKSFGQRYAYFPDSTSNARDKQNVRDGHYLPWSPTPYITKMNGAEIADPTVKRLYELVMATRTGDDVDALRQVVDVGLVPKCAMKVTRAGDGADLSLYDDPAPCGCYYEKNVPQGTTTCTECTGDGTCNGGKCRHGFCEAR